MTTKNMNALFLGFALILLNSSCYIQKETSVTVHYMQSSIVFNIPGNSDAAVFNTFLAAIGGTYSFQLPEQELSGFNLKEQIKKAGIDTVGINNKVKTLEIDSLWMEIDSNSLAIAGADFRYFNSIILSLNAKKLGTYTATSTPPAPNKTIIFTKGDNLKSTLLESNMLRIGISGIVNSIPLNSFKIKMGFKAKLVATLPLNSNL